ncbi:DUF2157 domain-containing protein [Microbacteriaceae bacterium 4G12]
MKKKDLERLIHDWIDREIITKEQGEKMFAETFRSEEERTSVLRLLPLLAATLLGLSLLTFIASNWNGMADVIKLAIIFLFIIVFYTFGFLSFEKGKQSWGIAGIFLGIVSFGAGMILISDMFQYQSYDATLFFFWSLFAMMFACLYRNPLLIGAAFVLTIVGQIYSLSSFQNIHFGIMLIATIGLAFIVMKEKGKYMLLFTLATIMQWCVFLPMNYGPTKELSIWGQFMQLSIPFFVLAIMKFVGEKQHISLLKEVPVFVLYLFYIYNILLPHTIVASHVKDIVIVVHILILLIVVSVALYKQYQTGKLFSSYKWLLFFPVLFLGNEIVADYAALCLIVIYPLGLLLEGYKTLQKQKITNGSKLFIVSMFAVYFQFGFTYMSKSLFFLIGAVLIIGLYFFLSRKQKQILEQGRGKRK